MLKALQYYQKMMNSKTKGHINDTFETYKDAKEARIKFIENNKNHAVYMAHGGIDVMCGHASLGIEIDEDLNKLGIGKDKRVAVIVPVGAGGLVGAVAGIKTRRPDAIGIITQTSPYSAFIRSLISGTMQSNLPNPEPTIVIDGNAAVFEDGIAVDMPETEAVDLAKKIVDCGVVVDPKENFFSAAPLLYHDLSKYPNPIVGGTTSENVEALLEYPQISAIKDADVIVIIGTEKMSTAQL